ncbi:MAG: hypothetical protein ABIP48_29220 [Planctomycetota bacterium]
MLVAALLVACVLPAALWMGRRFLLFVVLPIGVIPGCVLLEYLVGQPPVAQPRQSRSWYVRSHAILLACAAVPAVVAMFVERAAFAFAPGDLPLWSPLPLLVMLPQLLALPGWAIAAVSFLLLNLYLGRAVKPSPLPTRFPIVLGAATILSVAWFASIRLDPTMAYFQAWYVWGVSAINVAFVGAIWMLWLLLRRQATTAQTLALAILLHCWLFWFAFPFCSSG